MWQILKALKPSAQQAMAGLDNVAAYELQGFKGAIKTVFYALFLWGHYFIKYWFIKVCVFSTYSFGKHVFCISAILCFYLF